VDFETIDEWSYESLLPFWGRSSSGALLDLNSVAPTCGCLLIAAASGFEKYRLNAPDQRTENEGRSEGAVEGDG
jgi:hypothetical protein